jgi:hypothetical protein
VRREEGWGDRGLGRREEQGALSWSVGAAALALIRNS